MKIEGDKYLKNIFNCFFKSNDFAGHIIQRAGNSVEDVNATLSLKICFVNVVDRGSELVLPQENTKKKLELRRDWFLCDFILTLVYNVPYAIYPIMVHISPRCETLQFMSDKLVET
jgi:hypothetical protein